MSYSHEKKLKKPYDGSSLIPITVEKEILKARKSIEDMSNLQTGGDLELLHQAYTEIQEAQGKRVSKLNPACSGCTMDMKKLLRNWFKMYDNRPFFKPNLTSQPNQHLWLAKDLDSKGKPSYPAMKKRFEAEASEQVQKSINDGKPANKKQLNEYFNKAKPKTTEPQANDDGNNSPS